MNGQNMPFHFLLGIALILFALPQEASEVQSEQPTVASEPDVDQLRQRNAELDHEISEAESALDKLAREREQVEQGSVKEEQTLAKQIEVLSDQIDTLKAEKGDKQKQLTFHLAVNKAPLPENPTRDQVKAYITQVRGAIEELSWDDHSRPEFALVPLLKAVPDEHADLLVAEVIQNNALINLSYKALTSKDPEKVRQSVVKHIEDTPENIGVVVVNGWAADIRPVVLRKFKNSENGLPVAWFYAAVEVADPSMYPKLHELATRSTFGDDQSPATVYLHALEILPDYDFHITASTVFQKVQEGKIDLVETVMREDNQQEFLVRCAEAGNLGALEMLISSVTSPAYPYQYYAQENLWGYPTRQKILKVIDFRGTNPEIQAWFNKHKDKIEFDPIQARFTVPANR